MKFSFRGFTTGFLAPLLLFLLSLSVIISSLGGSRGLLHLVKINKQVQQLTATNDELEREIALYRSRIADLQAHGPLLEKVAREDIRLARPNEIVYLFSKPPAK